jgi:hypothetical protein
VKKGLLPWSASARGIVNGREEGVTNWLFDDLPEAHPAMFTMSLKATGLTETKTQEVAVDGHFPSLASNDSDHP